MYNFLKVMKYFISVVVTALIVGLGVTAYFKGWLPQVSFTKPQAVSVQGTEVATPINSPAVSPTPTALTPTEIKAGGILSMSAYSINIPSDWSYSKDGSIAGQSDKLTITKGAYSITISQGAFGGGGCLYPGDADSEMSQRFTSFTAITDQSGDNLRLSTLSSGGYVVCQGNGTSWGDITSFGHISVTAPAGPDMTLVSQINSILSSLKKI